MSFVVWYFHNVTSLCLIFISPVKTYPPHVRNKTLFSISCLFQTFLSMLFATPIKVYPLLYFIARGQSWKRHSLRSLLEPGCIIIIITTTWRRENYFYLENKKYRCIIAIDPCSLFYLSCRAGGTVCILFCSFLLKSNYHWKIAGITICRARYRNMLSAVEEAHLFWVYGRGRPMEVPDSHITRAHFRAWDWTADSENKNGT